MQLTVIKVEVRGTNPLFSQKSINKNNRTCSPAAFICREKKNLHRNIPMQFKPVLFNGQLYVAPIGSFSLENQ